MTIRYSKDKDAWLRKNRGISFNDIIKIIKEKRYIGIKQNPSKNHQDQKCYIIKNSSYIYLAPFVQDKKTIILKTIYPSQKYTAIYLN